MARLFALIRRYEMFGSLLPEEVFVTDGFPEYTYVSIDQGKPERDLTEGLEQKNKIISIVGPSKSGKSTLCDKFFGRNVGADKIYVTGGSVTYDNDLWREAYRQVSDDTEKIFEDRAHAEVIEYLVEKELPLIVDDFHYINRDTQISVCRQFKNAASAGLRIVILSVPHRGDDPIRSNPDLTGRHFSVDFRFWTIDDLKKIAELGFPRVGLESSANFNEFLAVEALRSPQIMQTLCLEVCRGLSRDRPFEHVSVEEIDRADVKTRTLRSYQMLSAFHILLNGPPERGSKRLDYELIDGSKADVYQILAHVLRLDPPFLQLSLDEIKQRVRSLVKDTREPNIRGTLQQIEGIYKDTAPPIEWDDEKRQLTIIDPHFYYYLRNTDAIRRVPKNSDPRQPLLL
jgi:hypothetical protein